jgi:hypothetical protein
MLRLGIAPPSLNRTAQAAAAGQVMNGVALAVGAGLFPNRREQDPQPKRDLQDPQQAGPGSLQEHGGPANGERRPRAWPGQWADARRLRQKNLATRWLQAAP